MSRKFLSLVLAAACCTFCFAGCGDNGNGTAADETPAERKAKFDSDLLCGFHFTFYKDGFSSPVEELNKSLESGEAVASYFIEEYVEGPHGGYINLKGYDGEGVFLNNQRTFYEKSVDRLTTEHSILLEETLYLTHEYPGKNICVEWLYYNEDTKEISHRETTLINGYFSQTGQQHLTAEGVNKNGEKYTVTYNASIKYNKEGIDKLTDVKILEYGGDNAVIKTSEIANEGKNAEYTPTENCEYIVIAEEYTDEDGEKHYERTLFDKNTDKTKRQTVILKFPYKSGLVKPVELNIKW